MPPISKSETFARLPPEWPDDLLAEIQRTIAASQRKLVVLDDDPTGTQTVHQIAVLTEWSVEALSNELQNEDPCVFILTNSRSLPLVAAQALNREIGRNLTVASQQTQRPFAAVSRSDSTLRGHFPGETNALADALGLTVDATLIIPFFLEGGRFTIDNVHYVAEGDRLIPAAETPFARDAAFGYHSSDLCQWVEEKTGARVRADEVAAISLDDLRRAGPASVTERLLAIPKGGVGIVNAASMRDMQVFVLGLLGAEAQGRNFLYRTAASFVQTRAGIVARPLLSAAELALPPARGGLIVVGSYVPKTTGQLGALLDTAEVSGIEVDVPALLSDQSQPEEIQRAVQTAEALLATGQDVVLFTSRGLITQWAQGAIIAEGAEASLGIGQRVSASLVTIVRSLRTRPRYLLAKGGITSSDIATQGLAVKRATVLGQILPGVPVWRTGPESRLPGLVYIVFPGNVGDERALVDAVERLRP